MHLSRPVAIRVVISTALSVMNLLIGSSVPRSNANQRVFPLVPRTRCTLGRNAHRSG
jgi:hypothetical protein